MKTTKILLLKAVIVVLFLPAALFTRLHAASCNYIGPGNGTVNFENAAMWSCGTIPGPGDDVFIFNVNTTNFTIQLNNPRTIGSLTMFNGTLQVNTTLTVSGALSFQGGSLNGTGLVIINGATSFTTTDLSAMGGSVVLRMAGGGSFNKSGGGQPHTMNGTSKLELPTGATFTLTAGTIDDISAGTSSCDFMGNLTASGTIEPKCTFASNTVAANNLTLSACTFSGATINITGSLIFQGGTTTATNTAFNNGIVSIPFGNPTITLNMGCTLTGQLRLDGGCTFNDNAGIQPAYMRMRSSAAVFAGSGSPTVNGAFDLEQGEISGSGTMTVTGYTNFIRSSTIKLSGSRNLTLTGDGSTNGTLDFYGSGTLLVPAGKLFRFLGAGSFNDFSGGTALFKVQGTARNVAVNFALNVKTDLDGGLWQQQATGVSYTSTFAEGGNWNNATFGTFNVGASYGAILFSAGTYSISGANSSSSSSFSFTNNATFQLGSSAALTLASLVNNGTVSGNGTLTVSGTFTNNGLFSPGFSPGSMTIGGNLPAKSNLQTEITGTGGPGLGHDLLTVTGNMALGANHKITVLPASPPGGQYIVAQCNGGPNCRTGQFDPGTSSLPAHYNLVYNGTSAKVCVGPDLVTTAAAICLGESIDLALQVADNLNSTGNLTYYLLLADAQSETAALPTSTVNPTTTTTYFIRKNITGSSPVCFDIESVEITVNPLPTASITGDFVICAGETTTLSGLTDIGDTYVWSTTAATPTVSTSIAGNYSVTITDTPTGCQNSAATILTVNPLPTASITGDFVICAGETSTLSGLTDIGDTYMWSTTAATPTINASIAGNYSVTITDTPTGCQNSAATILTVNALPTASITGDVVICAGETSTLSGLTDIGDTYVWSTTAATPTINASIAGNYSVTITDTPTGCQNSAATILTVNPLPTASITGDFVICAGETSTLSGLTDIGDTYVWSTTAATPTISTSIAGNYSVTITDTPTGCQNSAATILTVNPLPTASITGDFVICAGETSTLSGLTDIGDTYMWSTTAATPTINASIAGNYSVTITDTPTGCQNSAATILTVNALPTASITGDFIICAGETSTFTATGGVSYAWSTMDNTASITVGTAGAYTVTATDANGCTDLHTVSLGVNSLPIANISGDLDISDDETTTLTAAGGLTYLWSTNETTPSITTGTAGTYMVTVTDSNDCTDTESVTLVVQPLPLELLSFNAQPTGRTNLLTWQTATEKNVRSHIVERSIEGIYWKEIGQRSGQANSQTPTKYQLEDYHPVAFAYYRLRSVDTDGGQSISKSILIEREEQKFSIQSISPNPATDQVIVQFAAWTEEKVMLRLMDMTGQLVQQQILTVRPGINAASFSVNHLPAGIYNILLNSDRAVAEPVQFIKR